MVGARGLRRRSVLDHTTIIRWSSPEEITSTWRQAGECTTVPANTETPSPLPTRGMAEGPLARRLMSSRATWDIKQKGRWFSVTARLWLGFTITAANMATNGFSDLDHGWFGPAMKGELSPSCFSSRN